MKKLFLFFVVILFISGCEIEDFVPPQDLHDFLNVCEALGYLDVEPVSIPDAGPDAGPNPDTEPSQAEIEEVIIRLFNEYVSGDYEVMNLQSYHDGRVFRFGNNPEPAEDGCIYTASGRLILTGLWEIEYHVIGTSSCFGEEDVIEEHSLFGTYTIGKDRIVVFTEATEESPAQIVVFRSFVNTLEDRVVFGLTRLEELDTYRESTMTMATFSRPR